MNLLTSVLNDDPASPRLTIYDEAAGFRLDFSGLTLDNWAAKVANMLREELDLDEGATISCVLPVSWQAVVIALGAYAAGVTLSFDPAEGEVLFIAHDAADGDLLEHARALGATGDVVAVTADPMGRGVEETGGELPPGIIDFAPTVRFYGDQFYEDGPALADAVPAGHTSPGARVLSFGWDSVATLGTRVLDPIARGGSAVVVRGLTGPERVAKIRDAEKVTEQA